MKTIARTLRLAALAGALHTSGPLAIVMVVGTDELIKKNTPRPIVSIIDNSTPTVTAQPRPNHVRSLACILMKYLFVLSTAISSMGG